MKTDTGTVYGKEYYIVDPVVGAFGTWHPEWSQRWNKMFFWAVGTFGSIPPANAPQPGARWYAYDEKFWFREEQDYALFLLRWS